MPVIIKEAISSWKYPSVNRHVIIAIIIYSYFIVVVNSQVWWKPSDEVSYANCYLQVDWQGKNDITMKLTIRSLNGIHAELSGHAAEVLRTLSSRHRIYTVYFAILL